MTTPNPPPPSGRSDIEIDQNVLRLDPTNPGAIYNMPAVLPATTLGPLTILRTDKRMPPTYTAKKDVNIKAESLPTHIDDVAQIRKAKQHNRDFKSVQVEKYADLFKTAYPNKLHYGKLFGSPFSAFTDIGSLTSLKILLKKYGFGLDPKAAKILATKIPTASVFTKSISNMIAANRGTLLAEDVITALMSLDESGGAGAAAQDYIATLDEPPISARAGLYNTVRLLRDFTPTKKEVSGRLITTETQGQVNKSELARAANLYHITRKPKKATIVTRTVYEAAPNKKGREVRVKDNERLVQNVTVPLV
jgi:hypothetical protein